MDAVDDVLVRLMSRLRSAGSDTAEIEVKAAAGGLPQSLGSTLCGLANRPGGGWVILGLDESRGFAPVDLPDVPRLKQGLASISRAYTPPVGLEIEDATVSGHSVIVARVAECSPSQKPCREAASGNAWLRAWDGDYRMSTLEEQGFLAQRTSPTFDREPVPEASFDDLDPSLVELWFDTAGRLDPGGLGRFGHRHTRLFHGGIVTADRSPTRAGLLALGFHPQRFYPRFVVNLAVTGAGAGIRASEVRTVSGPIPMMLDGALDWARKAFSSSVAAGPDGALRDVWSYPLEAFRELIGNALVHRDLDAWSEGEAIEVRLRPDRLVVTNPGGLYGITLDRLGLEGTTSARNARLVEVCRYARSSDGARVVETLATGIPRIYETLRTGGHPSPHFSDDGLRFTAVLKPAPKVQSSGGRRQTDWASVIDPVNQAMNESQRAVFTVLSVSPGPVDVSLLEQETGLKGPTIRKALRALRTAGLIEQFGGEG